MSINDSTKGALGKLLDGIKAVVPRDQPNPTPVVKLESISFDLWETIAYDLALDMATPDVIARAYNVSVEQLHELMRDQNFEKLLKAKQAEVSQLGTNADTAIKFRTIVGRASPEFLRRLMDKETSDKDFHNLFQTAVRLAQLEPQEDNDAPMPTIGQQVIYNISGIPGLNHLSGLPQEPMKTVHAELDDEPIEAEFVELPRL